jgi:fluoroquinolone resistance protein
VKYLKSERLKGVFMEQTVWNPPQEKTLENKTFVSVNFSKQSLYGYFFIDCTFKNCSFMETDCKTVLFSSCVFDRCDIGLAQLDGARFLNICFSDTKLIGLDFSKCNHKLLFSIAMQRCLLQCCNFSGINMKKTSFKGSKVHESSFTDTFLLEADFSECDLLKTIFHNANLNKANFCEAKNYMIDPLANKLKNAKFSFPEAINLLKGLGIEIV